MRKINFKTVTLFLFAIFSCISTPIFAQNADGNLLDSKYFSFESGEKSWYVQHKENWTLTTEKAASGTSSLKYSCSDISTAPVLMQVHAMAGKDVQPEKVILAPGDYTISLKVWLTDTAPISFSTSIAERKDISPFFLISWKLKNVEKNKWVELSQKISIESPLNSRMVISVSNNPKWGGAGVIYIDDIKIVK